MLEQAKGEKNLYCAIGKQEELSGYVVHTPYENLDLIPSSTLMSSIEYELFTKWQREFILRKCIQKIKDAGNYDYILIDAPPTLGGWVMNILCASDRVIIPVEASPWGMFGLANMFEFLNEVKQITPELEEMRDYIENGIVADYQDHHYPSEMSVDAMIQTYLMNDSADATDTFMKRFDKEWIRYNRDVVAKVKAYEEGNDHE